MARDHRRTLVAAKPLAPLVVGVDLATGERVLELRLRRGGSNQPDGLAAGTVDGRTVFVVSRERVRAVDLDSGRTRWRYERAGLSPYGVEVAGGLVLVRVIERARGAWLPDGPVVALDAATGRVRWEHGWASAAFATGPAGLPVVSGTAVYVPSTGPTIHALELASGRERWSARIASGENPATVVPVEGGVVAAVRIDEQPGDRSRAHERVVRLASRDGAELWHSDRARGGFWSLTVDAARVYVATVPLNGGPPTTYALDRQTGATRWSARHLSSLTPIGASLIGFGRADSDYYAVRVDPRSGKEASSRVPLSPPSTGVQPVETGDPALGRAAIASDEARLSLVTRDGRVAWSTIVAPDAPCGIFRHADTPSISGHVAYVVVSDERTICEG